MNKEKGLFYNDNYPPTLSEFSDRYRSAFQLLKATPLVTYYQVISGFRPIDLEKLVLVHDRRYIKRLTNIFSGEEKDPQISKEALLFDALATRGSELAVDFAYPQKTVAYHLGGGFHHAMPNAPGAYDYCNDVAYAAARAIERGAKKILIIDLDVHHANGTEEIFWNNNQVFQISFHGSGIYPGTGLSQNTGGREAKGTKFNLPLPAGTDDELYLEAIEEIILPLAKLVSPEFIIYQAGVDTHHSDPLGNLKLTLNGLYERDQMVRTLTEALQIGITIIRGGGYNDYFSPRANVNTLAAFANRPVIFSEEEEKESDIQIKRVVEKRVTFLKQIISQCYPI